MNSVSNSIQAKRLSVSGIASSSHITAWLAQFPADKQITAKMMLHSLQFVSRDMYSDWFFKVINALPVNDVFALYSVRKLDSNKVILWDAQGNVIPRPGVSQGSEDLVYSLISNKVRASPTKFLDHPSINDLREKKVHNIVLVDDSIGSGDRVSDFINAMLRHATFLSWWSLGLIKFHVVSFARPRETDARIIAKIRGSDNSKRKFRKSAKICFVSEKVYGIDWLESRWGRNFKDVLECCDQPEIPALLSRGWGEVMANIVFYHSVPDNLPGVIWVQSEKWNGLFPERALPAWLHTLLDDKNSLEQLDSQGGASVPVEIIQLLRLVKRGVRSAMSIALRLNCDNKFAEALLDKAKTAGFLSENYHLTKVGLDLLKQNNAVDIMPKWDHTLYIPQSWCAGQATIQPPTSGELAPSDWADSVKDALLADGEVGQASLEKSDAKAASPPFSVMSQLPAVTGVSHDTNGPQDSKER